MSAMLEEAPKIKRASGVPWAAPRAVVNAFHNSHVDLVLQGTLHEPATATALTDGARAAGLARVRKVALAAAAKFDASKAGKESARLRAILAKATAEVTRLEAAAGELDARVLEAIGVGENPAALQGRLTGAEAALTAARKWADAARADLEPAEREASLELNAALQAAVNEVRTDAAAEEAKTVQAMLKAIEPHLAAIQAGRHALAAASVEQALAIVRGQ
jgi:hypothetical protein